jgi:hypothetical protein
VDGLRHLLAAGLPGIENATEALSPRRWGAEILVAAVVGLAAFVCLLIVAVWSAMTLNLALQGEFSDVAAAGLTAVAFVALIGLLVLGLKLHYRRPKPAEVPSAVHGEAEMNLNLMNFASLLPQSRPLKIWDLATLVAVGVVAGLSKNAEPR